MLGKEISYFVKLFAYFILSVFILEILVRGIILILNFKSPGYAVHSESHSQLLYPILLLCR